MNRKLLVIPLVVLFSAYNAIGQVERMHFGNSSSYQLSKTSRTTIATRDNTKEMIFSEDFEAFEITLDQTIWEVKQSTDTTGFDMANTTGLAWFLCKPSSFSGNGFTYIQSGTRAAAISYQALDATWLITKEPISIASSGLSLNFWLYYLNKPSQGIKTNFYVMASEAGTDIWESIGKWEEDSPSNQFESIVSIPIPDQFVDKEIVIAFVYVNKDNSGIQVAIDNVFLGDLTEPNLAIKAYNYPFSSIPLALVSTFDYSLSAYINNSGTLYEGAGATAKVSIEQLPDFDSQLEVAMNIANGSPEFITFANKPVFEEAGSYEIVYSIVQQYGDEGGDGKTKSTSDFTFNITPNTLATDYCNSAGIAGGFTTGKDIPFGNKYPINSDVVVAGIEIQWSEFTAENTFTGQIYEINPTDNTLQLIVEKEFTIDSEQLDESKVYPIDPLYLTSGAEFFVAAVQTGTTPLMVGFDQVYNGQFWRLRNGSLDLLSSPSFGNIAIRLVLESPIEAPSLSFLVSDGVNAIEGATIQIGEKDEITTNAEGKASINLKNGWYSYSVSMEGYAAISEDILINYANLQRTITLLPEYTLKLILEDVEQEPVVDADVFIANQSGQSNAEGQFEANLAKGIHSFTIMKENVTVYTENVDLVSDSTISITLQAAVTYNVDFAIAARHLNAGLEKVMVNLSGYGTKYTNTEGVVQFSGILPADNGVLYTISKTGYDQITEYTAAIIDQSILVEDTLDIKTYYVRIEIISEGSPINKAKVKLGSQELQTNANGIALFDDIIPSEKKSLKVSKEGYLPIDTTLSLYNGNIRVTYIIDKAPSAIPNNIQNVFTAFPNPFDSEFSIQGEGIYQFEVIDITGRTIISRRIGQSRSSVNMSGYTNGIYFLKIVQEDRTIIKRIIKQ